MKRSPLTPKCISLISSAALLPVSIAVWTPVAQAQNPDGFIPVDTINATPPGGTAVQTFTDIGYAPLCDPTAVSFPGCRNPGALVDVTFGDGGNRILQSLEGDDFTGTQFTFTRNPIANEILVFRRSSPNERENLFFETTAIGPGAPPTTINLSPDPSPGIEAALLSFIVNRGIDNVFDNAGKGGGLDFQNTINNIERIDFIIPDGEADDPTDAESRAFLVLERGGNDRFFIAAITALGPGNVPIAYGPLREVNVGDWGLNSIPIDIETTVVDRLTATSPALPSHLVPQQPIQGILFPLNYLLEPADAGGTVFGYSLFAGDTPPGTPSASLVDINNTTVFPRDTLDESLEGGLDLVASGFGILTTQAQPFAFAITPDTDLTTAIGEPIDHPFTVTNTGTSPDTITLTTDGTDPNYTTEIIDPATGNVVTDTGELQPGASINYVLRVTPGPNATTPDTTIVRGTNSLDNSQEVTKITRLVSFLLTPDGELTTTIGQPVDHPFTVTNTGTDPDTINLVPEGTDPNYTTEFINPATGNPLTDTNGDNIPDTGSLPPGQSTDLVLRVTPGPNAVDNDTTIVRGTSVLNGGSQTIQKITIIQSEAFTITPDGDLFTTIGTPARHDFEVTVTGGNPDTIDLTTTGTSPEYTVEIVDRGTGQPLTDTDGDGVIDTGSLNPNEPRLLTLLVTPQPGATAPDTTVIQGTDSNNTTQDVTKITRIANFSLTPDGELQTTIGQPVEHPFTVTNLGTEPDTINLVPEGTDPNYTTEFINPATGNPLTDTNGDNIPDTGSLPPGQSTDLVLRVTPGPNAVNNDTTIVRGTSVVTGASLTVEKRTIIQPAAFTMTPDSDLFTVIGTPARHDFEVTITGTSPDTINLTNSGTDPNYTLEYINRATGEPLTDTDGDGVIDTGSLNPNQPALLTLLVTPQAGATVPDTTIVTGTNSNGDTQQVTKITRLANFSLTDNGELQTPIGQPVDHPFTVTNLGNVPDTINLVPVGTDPNFTTQFIDPATGNPLTDTNGDNIPDTGSLPPGGSANLILRVTPGSNATTPDTTVIQGTSVDTGAVLTIDRITSLPADTSGDIALTKRITRVFRVGTGQGEVYNTENPASLPGGFVGVTSPTPQELAPGDLVEYTVYFTNNSTGLVTNLEICDPIPTESSFLADPSVIPDFQDIYGGGQGIAYDAPAPLPLGNGVVLTNVFDGDQGEFVNPLTPRASCPGESSGNQGAVVVRVGSVAPGQSGFIKFVTRLE